MIRRIVKRTRALYPKLKVWEVCRSDRTEAYSIRTVSAMPRGPGWSRLTAACHFPSPFPRTHVEPDAECAGESVGIRVVQDRSNFRNLQPRVAQKALR
jgi:hypothetical protein